MSKVLQPHSTRADGITVIVEIANVGIMLAAGPTVPSDATRGFGPSCIFQKTSGNGIGTSVYKNEGSFASSDFNAV